MLKTIYRSILKELLAAFTLTLAFLSSVLVMERLLKLSRMLAGVGATLYDMVRIVFYLQFQIMLLTVPMSLLLATLLVYGRMNQDSELTILKTCGMDFGRIARPVLILGTACFIFNFAVSFYLQPASSKRLRDEISNIITLRSTSAIEEGTFNTAFKDIVIIFKGKKSPTSLQQIFIYDNRVKEEPKVLMAEEGTVTAQDRTHVGLDLKNGFIGITKDQTVTELFFERYHLIINLDIESQHQENIEFTPSELFAKARSAESRRKQVHLLLELHRRFSLPAVCLIMVFIGPPLAMIAGKSGRLGGLALGLLVFTAYYTLLIYGENLVVAERLPHYIGAWLATTVLGAAAVFIFRRAGAR